MTAKLYSFTRWRELEMPCCKHQLSWIGDRDPNWCPECGAGLTLGDKGEPTVLIDGGAYLIGRK